MPPGRALLDERDSVAVGSVGGWNVVTLGNAMRDGTWEWEVEFVGGSSACLLAVFEGAPQAASRYPNSNDDNVLCTAMAGSMRYVRGASDRSGPDLGVRAGQRLRVRYVSEAGTVDASVDGRTALRALEGVRRGDVRAGFFLSGTSKIRLLSFKFVETSQGMSRDDAMLVRPPGHIVEPHTFIGLYGRRARAWGREDARVCFPSPNDGEFVAPVAGSGSSGGCGQRHWRRWRCCCACTCGHNYACKRWREVHRRATRTSAARRRRCCSRRVSGRLECRHD